MTALAVPPMTIEEIIRRERLAVGPAMGAFDRQRILESSPAQVKRDMELARRFPEIMMGRQGFASMDVVDAPPTSHAAIASTTTETSLWKAMLWGLIPAFDMRAGKVYKMSFGGIIQTTGTPTYIWTPRILTADATPPTGISLGVSATVTAGTIAASSPFFGEFTFVVRSLGIAAAGTTVTGNGFVVCAQAAGAVSQAIAFGASVPTTVDHTVATGLSISLTWSASSASNTCTCQWTAPRSYN